MMRRASNNHFEIKDSDNKFHMATLFNWEKLHRFFRHIFHKSSLNASIFRFNPGLVVMQALLLNQIQHLVYDYNLCAYIL